MSLGEESTDDRLETGENDPGARQGDIEAAVRLAFQRSNLRRVDCRFESDRLILQGNVPTYHMKQLAQIVAGRVAGVVWIMNQIEVDQRRAR